MGWRAMRNWITPALAVVALAGCGSGKQATIAADDGDVMYRLSGDAGPEGETTVYSGNDLSPDLPDGLAVYPGAKVTNVANVGLDKGTGALVAMDTADGSQEVTEWYKSVGEKAGYRIEAQLQAGKLHMVSGKADDGREFSVTASDRDGGTSVQLIAGSGLDS